MLDFFVIDKQFCKNEKVSVESDALKKESKVSQESRKVSGNSLYSTCWKGTVNVWH